MEPVVSAAANGINRMWDYGLAMVILGLVGICAFYLVKYLLNRCDERFTESLRMHRETTDKVIEVVNQNTKAITEFRMELRAGK